MTTDVLSLPPTETRLDRGSRVIEHHLAPVIRREGIDWIGGVDELPLVVLLTFENPHPVPTPATEFVLALADFGAFVPGRPLTAVGVPGMGPGENRRVAVVARDVEARNGRLGAARATDVTSEPSAIRALTEWIHANWQSFCQGGALPSRVTGNVVVQGVEGQIVCHRHMSHVNAVQPGEWRSMPFYVGARSGEFVMSVREKDCGWEVELAPGEFGVPTGSGTYAAQVRPSYRATGGALVIDVQSLDTGEVCPVEWYWGDRQRRGVSSRTTLSRSADPS